MNILLKTVLLLLVFILNLTFCNAQKIPENYFSPPMDIPMFLSGNFGEMRTNHFHTGIDIKTQGKIGFPVLSIDDGWVSRIKVSTSGYGNAVYIDHPNGYTSVYAHLDSYNDEISEFLKNAQYNIEEFRVDIYPGKGKIPVKRNEEIGKSGNTGHSGGPHLHFEIRETDTEFPVNPLLFGFDIKDNKEPKAYSIMAIPLDNQAKVYGNEIYDVIGNNRINATISVSGNVGFALKTYDYFDGSTNMCGTFQVKLYRDDQLIYSHTLDKLDFSTNRFVNAHVVYDYFKKNKSRFQRSYKLPFDQLSIYDKVLEEDQCFHEPNKIYKYRYELIDFHGNSTEVNFEVKAKETKDVLTEDELVFNFDQANEFHGEGISVYVPNGRLYNNVNFECHSTKKINGAITPSYKVSSQNTPLHDYIVVKIKTDNIDSVMHSKAVMVRYDSKKDKTTSLGGDYREGWMELKTKVFGIYGVMIDSIAPKITALDFKYNMKSKKTLTFKITDNLSGIYKYRVMIDGKWVLGKYFPNRAKLIYTFDEERLNHGKHSLLVMVKDGRGNETIFTDEFEW